ncbi:MAG: response regulator [Planctomycetota bacterium]
MRVLVADDSRVARMVIRGIIENIGHEVVEAANGREVLEKVEELNGDVNLVILDWHMPELEGVDTLKSLKNDKRFKHIPVMMMTSESEQDNVDQAMALGATCYVSKPYNKEDLSFKIEECLYTNKIDSDSNSDNSEVEQ